uniref:hypothetical protein n=1 Tax=Vibrio campbellii TaxID=680 RepID=UPI000AA2E413
MYIIDKGTAAVDTNVIRVYLLSFTQTSELIGKIKFLKQISLWPLNIHKSIRNITDWLVTM